MAEKYLGPSFEIHGGGLDLVFPHHENEIAQSQGAGREFARIWIAQRDAALLGEEMHKSAGNIVTLREALERWGRETMLLFFMTRPLAQAARLLATRRWPRPPRARRGSARSSATRPSRRRRRVGAASPPRSTTTSTRPEALAIMHEWRDHDLLGAALAVFGLESLAQQEQAPAEIVDLAERRQRAREERDFGEADRLRARSRRPAGRCATSPRRRLPARPPRRVTRELVYGRRPCARRCAAGARCFELWATERARRGEPWLETEGGRARPVEGRARARARRPARATTRACSRSASRTATPTRTSSPTPSGR